MTEQQKQFLKTVYNEYADATRKHNAAVLKYDEAVQTILEESPNSQADVLKLTTQLAEQNIDIFQP